RDLGKCAVLSLPITKIGVGDRSPVEVGFAFVDADQLVRLRKRQRVQKHAVDDRKQRRVRANAESKRDDRDRREAGALPQHPQAKTHILQQSFHRLTRSAGPPWDRLSWRGAPGCSRPAEPLQPEAQRQRRRSPDRSEEHTSELQSRGHLVCRLLLEKKKNKTKENKCSDGADERR